MTTVSIIGATFTGNHGAEAMLSALIRRLGAALPDAHFAVFSYYPGPDRAQVRDESVTVFSATPARVCLVLVPCSLLLRAIRWTGWKWIEKLFPTSVTTMARSRVLLDIAGVSFVDGREKFLPYNVLTILPAMILGTPVVKLAQAMGPFRNRLNRFLARRVLRGCRKIFARGAATQGHLEDLGLDAGSIRRADDVTFLHRPGEPLTEDGAEHVAGILGRLEKARHPGQAVVGICPSSLVYAKVRKEGGDYARFLKDLAAELLQRGHAVLLFPGATRAARRRSLRNNDLPVIGQIARLLEADGHAEGLLYVTEDVSAEGIDAMTRQCSATLVSRFHAVVASLRARTPLCVVGWGHKYREVMEAFDLGQFVLDYRVNDVGQVLSAVESLLAQSESIRSRIAQHLPQAKASAAGQIEYVQALLANRTD